MASNINNNNNNINFHYISAWEKHEHRGSSTELSGHECDILDIIVNIDFLAHEAQSKDAFDPTLHALFELVTGSDVNARGTLTPFWKFTNILARKILWIHPDWESYIEERLKAFDEEHCVPFMKDTEKRLKQEGKSF